MSSLKVKVRVKKIMYPKGGIKKAGEFAIISCEPLENNKEIKLHNEYGTFSVKGIMPTLCENDEFILGLKNPQTNKWGTTYELDEIKLDLDIGSSENIEQFLTFIAGSKITKELMKLENPIELIKKHKDKELLKVKGIGATKLERIYEQFETIGDRSNAYAKLKPLGLTEKLINKLCSSLGGEVGAIDICLNDPYSLIGKVKGIGFAKADEIALKCNNIDKDKRVCCAIEHVLGTNAEMGRSYLNPNQLYEALNGIIGDVDFTFINKKVHELCERKKIAISESGEYVALTKYIKLEKKLAEVIIGLIKCETHIKIPENYKEVINMVEQEQGWKHTDEQLKGIEVGLNNNVVVIRGLAGTGKSTVTNVISRILNKYEIDMCCLSAKASQRLKEVTGRDAQTIHRLLGLGFENDSESELTTDILILDEASMVNGDLMLKLLSSIRKGTKVFILGDTGQLTSIGSCSVFKDMISSGVVPVVELTKIHRQASKSAIITESREIREQTFNKKLIIGEKLVLGKLQDLEIIAEEKENLLKHVVDEFQNSLQKVKNVLDVQIIAPVKNGEVGINKINREIQSKYNGKNMCDEDYIEGKDKVRIYRGDKIINTKNNYKTKNVSDKPTPIFNGSLGVVKQIEDDGIIVEFIGIGLVKVEKNDCKNINLGYAITCHSSQGSQWSEVIFTMDMGSYLLLNVEMLYTAITRSICKCKLIIEPKSFNMALKKVEQDKKQTLLSGFLAKC